MTSDMLSEIIIGIVGNAADKFTKLGEQRAKAEIQKIIMNAWLRPIPIKIISGHSPLGGIDLWTEEAIELLRRQFSTDDIKMQIFAPEVHEWQPDPNLKGSSYGFRQRNLDIAKTAIHGIHVIVADRYPENYKGHKFDKCYHCAKAKRNFGNHVKSGACWTLNEALKLGKKGEIHIINNRRKTNG